MSSSVGIHECVRALSLFSLANLGPFPPFNTYDLEISVAVIRLLQSSRIRTHVVEGR